MDWMFLVVSNNLEVTVVSCIKNLLIWFDFFIKKEQKTHSHTPNFPCIYIFLIISFLLAHVDAM